jgi:ubiquinone biosynthesis protein
MIRRGQLWRLLQITRILVKHDLDEFISAIHLFRPYRWLLRIMPWRWRPGRRVPRGVRLREALEELGPIFVKFGQIVSTRPDLLPEDLAEELSKLQDRVPPFPGEQAVAVVEQAYGVYRFRSLPHRFGLCRTGPLRPVAGRLRGRGQGFATGH